MAYEELYGDNYKAEGNRFEPIGLLAIFGPPCKDTKQTFNDALAFGVKLRWPLAWVASLLLLSLVDGRRLGLGDHLYPAKVLKDGPPLGSQFPSLDNMIMDADRFAGVFPDSKLSSASRVLVIFVP